MEYNLERFIKAQDFIYEEVIRELKAEYKLSHWMWFIFPQLADLGYSYNAIYYGIKSLDEAKAYMENAILAKRYLECLTILLNSKNDDISEILGDIDGMKFKSSVTLFMYVSDNDVFQKILDKFYDGQKDLKTIALLNDINKNKKEVFY